MSKTPSQETLNTFKENVLRLLQNYEHNDINEETMLHGVYDSLEVVVSEIQSQPEAEQKQQTNDDEKRDASSDRILSKSIPKKIKKSRTVHPHSVSSTITTTVPSTVNTFSPLKQSTSNIASADPQTVTPRRKRRSSRKSPSDSSPNYNEHHGILKPEHLNGISRDDMLTMKSMVTHYDYSLVLSTCIEFDIRISEDAKKMKKHETQIRSALENAIETAWMQRRSSSKKKKSSSVKRDKSASKREFKTRPLAKDDHGVLNAFYEYNVTCKLCNRLFLDRDAYLLHLRTHLKDHQHCHIQGCDPTKRIPNPSYHLCTTHSDLGWQKPFCCKLCNERFPNWSKMRSHLNKTHGKTE